MQKNLAYGPVKMHQKLATFNFPILVFVKPQHSHTHAKATMCVCLCVKLGTNLLCNSNKLKPNIFSETDNLSLSYGSRKAFPVYRKI